MKLSRPNFIKLVFHVLIGFVVSSCCHKKDCDGVENIAEINLINFSLTQVDSIVIKTYQKDSNFDSMIDSFFTNARGRQEGDSDLIIFMPQRLNMSLDYEIEFTEINMKYFMSGFASKKEECNDCFPSGHTYVTVLDYYFVNGERITTPSLQIKK